MSSKPPRNWSQVLHSYGPAPDDNFKESFYAPATPPVPYLVTDTARLWRDEAKKAIDKFSSNNYLHTYLETTISPEFARQALKTRMI